MSLPFQEPKPPSVITLSSISLILSLIISLGVNVATDIIQEPRNFFALIAVLLVINIGVDLFDRYITYWAEMTSYYMAQEENQQKLYYQTEEYYERICDVLQEMLKSLHWRWVRQVDTTYLAYVVYQATKNGGQQSIWKPRGQFQALEKFHCSFRYNDVWFYQAWTANQTILTNIDGVMLELFINDTQRETFADEALALVTPIYRPKSERKQENIIGMLVIYSSSLDALNHLNDDRTWEQIATIDDRLSLILSYDYITKEGVEFHGN